MPNNQRPTDHHEPLLVVRPALTPGLVISRGIALGLFFAVFAGIWAASLNASPQNAAAVGAGAVVLTVAVVAFGHAVRCRRKAYRFYEDRLEYTAGFFWSGNRTIHYDDIEEANFRAGPAQRRKGLGTITLGTASTGSLAYGDTSAGVELEDLPNARDLYKQIRQLAGLAHDEPPKFNEPTDDDTHTQRETPEPEQNAKSSAATRQRIIRSTESGTGLGFRIRQAPPGGVELRSSSRVVIGAVVALVFGLPALALVLGLPLGMIRPAGALGWSVIISIAAVAGLVAAFGLGMLRSGASTLTIEDDASPIASTGPRWNAARQHTLYPRRLRALYGGRESGDSDSGPRDVWILAIDCDTDELAGVDDGSGGGVIYPVRLDTTRSYSKRKVVAGGNRIADALGIPFADDTDRVET